MSVTINAYTPALADRFAAEKQRLAALLPPGTPIEHVGSTAVGIGGKNIIDILVGAPDRESLPALRDLLTKHGYFDGHDLHPDRIFLATSLGETAEGDYHIHLCPVSAPSYQNMLTLRDYLRAHPAKAQEYFNKKREFAAQANYDRKQYKAIKSAYVSNLIAEALAETGQ